MKGKGRQGHAENFKGENNTLLLGAGGGLVYESCPTLATPWTVAHQDPLSMRFSRQEYWSGLPRPPPGNLPDPEIKPASLESLISLALAGRSSPLTSPGKPIMEPTKCQLL